MCDLDIDINDNLSTFVCVGRGGWVSECMESMPSLFEY